jgi:hypothetical protein
MLSTAVSGPAFELRLLLIVTADTLRSLGVPAYRLLLFEFERHLNGRIK